MIDGTTFPVQELLPLITKTVGTYHLGDRDFNKSWAISLAAERNQCSCEICHRPAICFKFYTNHSITGTKNVIRLVFEHTDKNGNLAFMTVDHIVPKAKGGSPTDSTNLQLACNVCNSQKSDKTNFAVEKGIELPKIESGSWVNRLTYIAYIRWHIRTYDPNITHKGFHNGSSNMFRCIKYKIQKIGYFDTQAYVEAVFEIRKSIRLPKGMSSNKIRIVDLLDKV